jgi:hypothetical protein
MSRIMIVMLICHSHKPQKMIRFVQFWTSHVKLTPCASRMEESKMHSRCKSENLLSGQIVMLSRSSENSTKVRLCV